jgi:hypothetical protein
VTGEDDDDDEEDEDEAANTVLLLSERDDDFVIEHVLNVSLPANLDYFVDPIDLAGYGTLFSPIFRISNHGLTDVALKIWDIAYNFSDNGSFLSYTELPDSEIERYEKAIFMLLRQVYEDDYVDYDDSEFEYSDYLDLHYDDPDYDAVPEIIYDKDIEYLVTNQVRDEGFVVLLKAAEHDEDGNFIALNPGSTFGFELTGGIADGTSAPWLSGDVWLQMVYSFEIILPDEEELLDDEEELLDEEEELLDDEEELLDDGDVSDDDGFLDDDDDAADDENATTTGDGINTNDEDDVDGLSTTSNESNSNNQSYLLSLPDAALPDED